MQPLHFQIIGPYLYTQHLFFETKKKPDMIKYLNC